MDVNELSKLKTGQLLNHHQHRKAGHCSCCSLDGFQVKLCAKQFVTNYTKLHKLYDQMIMEIKLHKLDDQVIVETELHKLENRSRNQIDDWLRQFHCFKLNYEHHILSFYNPNLQSPPRWSQMKYSVNSIHDV